jgi:tetratricopeptide (TPR) repeat protein
VNKNKLLDDRIVLYLSNFGGKGKVVKLEHLAEVLAIPLIDLKDSLFRLMEKDLIERVNLKDVVTLKLTKNGEKYSKNLNEVDVVEWIFNAGIKENFETEQGGEDKLYLIENVNIENIYNLFYKLIDMDIQGLVISRPSKKGLMKKRPYVKYFMLTTAPGEFNIDPTKLISIISTITTAIPENGVLLFDGIEYLISQNGEESVIKFIQHTLDYLISKNITLLLPVLPDAISKRSLALLEREMDIIKNEEDLTLIKKPIINKKKEDFQDFVDMVSYLEAIEKNFKNKGEVFYVWGFSGVGKTTLVKKALSSYKHLEIWVDVGNNISEKRILEELSYDLTVNGFPMLENYLSTVDVVDTLHVMGILKEVLSNLKNFVIVFDNIHNAGESLIDIVDNIANICHSDKVGTLFVISRENNSMDKPFFNKIYLNGFDIKGVEEFLSSKGINDIDKAKKLYEATSGNPLLIKLVYNLESVDNVRITVSDYVKKIIDETTIESKEILGRLSVYGYPVSIKAIAFSDEDKKLIEKLVKTGFIQESKNGLVAVHDLIKEYFINYSSKENLNRWHDMAIKHYQYLISQSDDERGFISYEIVYHTLRRGDYANAKKTIVQNFVAILDVGLGKDLMNLFKDLVDKNKEDLEIQLLYAHLLAENHSYDESLKLYLDVLNKLHKLPKTEEILIKIGNIHSRIADICLYKQDIEDSMKNYEHCLDIGFTISNYDLLAHSYMGLGSVYLYEKKYELSYQYYSRLLELLDKLKDPYLVVNIYSKVATLFYNWNRYDEAIEYLMKGLEVCDKYSLHSYKAQLFFMLGRIQTYMNRLDYALSNFYSARKVFVRYSREMDISRVDYNISLLLYLKGKIIDCNKFLDEAKKIKNMVKDDNFHLYSLWMEMIILGIKKDENMLIEYIKKYDNKENTLLISAYENKYYENIDDKLHDPFLIEIKDTLKFVSMFQK